LRFAERRLDSGASKAEATGAPRHPAPVAKTGNSRVSQICRDDPVH
jgi:hypothetical protein